MAFKEITLSVSIRVYPSDHELTQEDRELLAKARSAAASAYAPYSNFFVGAAVRHSGGAVVSGNNQENAAYPSGMCAERTAVYYAGANAPNVVIEAVAVHGYNGRATEDNPVSPCGACRQALLEYEEKQGSPIRIILGGKTGKVLVIDSIKDLLPLSFGSKNQDL
ncbi:MAG TPA: cytidine deaminase [Bacteroidia bacterium]|nr:cytidine deaminase [Bacteroidia bacterium]